VRVNEDPAYRALRRRCARQEELIRKLLDAVDPATPSLTMGRRDVLVVEVRRQLDEIPAR
jgi:hypothetical protein